MSLPIISSIQNKTAQIIHRPRHRRRMISKSNRSGYAIGASSGSSISEPSLNSSCHKRADHTSDFRAPFLWQIQSKRSIVVAFSNLLYGLNSVLCQVRIQCGCASLLLRVRANRNVPQTSKGSTSAPCAIRMIFQIKTGYRSKVSLDSHDGKTRKAASGFRLGDQTDDEPSACSQHSRLCVQCPGLINQNADIAGSLWQ